MAYTDFTKIGENWRKKELSVFATGWIKPTTQQQTDGVVLGYLAPNSLVANWSILKKSTGTHDNALSGNLMVSGAAIASKLYTEQTPIELKGLNVNEEIMVVISFYEVELSNGKYHPLPEVILASDGTKAI